MKTILLTFDVEEFDLPREYKINLGKTQEFEISKTGLNKIIQLLEKHNTPATFFTTTDFAKKYPQLIKKISENHEIACHSYCHLESCESIKRLQQAKQEKEKIINKEIKGFRAPKFQIKQIKELGDIGFKYDSSTHPIWLPGKYFNFFQKRKIHKINNLIEIPISTLPINLSLFWLAFKNFPYQYSKIFTRLNFLFSNYTMLLFHPWEFTNINHLKLPFYIKAKSGHPLLKRLEDYIIFCKKQGYKFQTVADYLNL